MAKTAFPLVEIEGPPRERGKQYGTQAASQIANGLSLYRDAFANTGTSWDEAVSVAKILRPSLGSYDQDMAEEVEGIAIGAGVSADEVFILNARTEILYWKAGGNEIKAQGLSEECTSLVALPDATLSGHVLHGQNWDWNPRCADSAVVLRIKLDSGAEILTFVEAGQLARSGMNSWGVALTANGLQSSTDAGRIGTPNPFIRRRLLMQEHLATAIGTVLNAEISASHNLAISHRGGEAFQLETTPDESFWLEPEDGLLIHANHFKSIAAQSKLIDYGLTRCPESLYRDRRVRERARKEVGSIKEDTFRSIFSDSYGAPHAILRTPTVRPGGNLSGTVATILMNTTTGALWMARSPYDGDISYSEYGLELS